MKIHGNLTILEVYYPKGSEVPWYKVYPLFSIHVGVMGAGCFAMTYLPKTTDLSSYLFSVVFGCFGIILYLSFYLRLFGLDEIKWMFINAAIGIYGLWIELGILLSLIGRNINEFQWYMHSIPAIFWVLYTFLIRQCFLDMTGAREIKRRAKLVNILYAALSILLYSLLWGHNNA